MRPVRPFARAPRAQAPGGVWEAGVNGRRPVRRPRGRWPATEDQRPRVGRGYVIDQILRGRDEHREPGMDVRAPGKDDVVRGEGRAVVPGEPGAEAIRRLHSAVRKYLPAGRMELRQRLGQVRSRHARAVDEGKLGIEGPPSPPGRAGLHDLGGQIGCLLPQHEAQRAIRRRSLWLGRSRGGPGGRSRGPARCGEQHQYEGIGGDRRSNGGPPSMSHRRGGGESHASAPLVRAPPSGKPHPRGRGARC